MFLYGAVLFYLPLDANSREPLAVQFHVTVQLLEVVDDPSLRATEGREAITFLMVWESIKLSQPLKLYKEVLNPAFGGMKFLEFYADVKRAALAKREEVIKLNKVLLSIFTTGPPKFAAYISADIFKPSLPIRCKLTEYLSRILYSNNKPIIYAWHCWKTTFASHQPELNRKSPNYFKQGIIKLLKRLYLLTVAGSDAAAWLISGGSWLRIYGDSSPDTTSAEGGFALGEKQTGGAQWLKLTTWSLNSIISLFSPKRIAFLLRRARTAPAERGYLSHSTIIRSIPVTALREAGKSWLIMKRIMSLKLSSGLCGKAFRFIKSTVLQKHLPCKKLFVNSMGSDIRGQDGGNECPAGIKKALEEGNFSAVRIEQGELFAGYKEYKQVPFKVEGREKEIPVEEQKKLSDGELRNFKDAIKRLRLQLTPGQYEDSQRLTYIFMVWESIKLSQPLKLHKEVLEVSCPTGG